jgi:hypothetical protein
MRGKEACALVIKQALLEGRKLKLSEMLRCMLSHCCSGSQAIAFIVNQF